MTKIEAKEFIKNIEIFFIIIEVLSGVGVFAMAYFLTGYKLMSILLGVVACVWITYVLIKMLDTIKLLINKHLS